MDEIAWDEFAEEYYIIQEESQIPIVTDIVDYLYKESVLPAASLVDVAGGAGRYLPVLAEQVDKYELNDFSAVMLKYAQQKAKHSKVSNVVFKKQTFTAFLNSTEQYEVIFSAANPAFTKTEQVEKLMKKAKKWCVMVRVIKSEDDLFTAIDDELGLAVEDPNSTPTISNRIEAFLQRKKILVKKKDFTYQIKETISREFLTEYYEAEMTAELKERIEKLFNKKNELISTTTVTYRLLLWQITEESSKA
ncbi:class I SAM-dependent methyltransferase [Candidatus Enterococcus courvalinii]|uniref:Class I SAM-dependent methyltransferase n=1 Tax=Candidatus Enterococcus courvalinii TaxID=2815329 RepID=A0ABS3I2G5_9ENTE|nr:class I SAM-dependent methyltransferase [Enterococcus sp. MSG2901]MBO0481966.1 class I SAM-dependent methyltransferase [Enterococcus sp. MSG2901]